MFDLLSEKALCMQGRQCCKPSCKLCKSGYCNWTGDVRKDKLSPSLYLVAAFLEDQSALLSCASLGSQSRSHVQPAQKFGSPKPHPQTSNAFISLPCIVKLCLCECHVCYGPKSTARLPDPPVSADLLAYFDCTVLQPAGNRPVKSFACCLSIAA